MTEIGLARRAVDRYVSLVNSHRYSEIGDLFAADAVFQAPTGETIRGRTAIGAFFAASLPELSLERVWVSSSVGDHAVCAIQLKARMVGDAADQSHTVADFFSVNEFGEINRMEVFLAPADVVGSNDSFH